MLALHFLCVKGTDMEIHWRDDLLMNALIPSLPSTPFTLLGVVGDSVRHVITSSSQSKRKSQSSHCRTHFVCVRWGEYIGGSCTQEYKFKDSRLHARWPGIPHTHPSIFFFFAASYIIHQLMEKQKGRHIATRLVLYFFPSPLFCIFFLVVVVAHPGFRRHSASSSTVTLPTLAPPRSEEEWARNLSI